MKKTAIIASILFVILVASIFGASFIFNKHQQLVDEAKKEETRQATFASQFDDQELPFVSSRAIEIFLTADLVGTHNKKEDCWIIIGNDVYDVTSFVNQHPGGSDTIIKYCGADATKAFETKDKNPPGSHTTFARDLLRVYIVGSLGDVIGTVASTREGSSSGGNINSKATLKAAFGLGDAVETKSRVVLRQSPSDASSAVGSELPFSTGIVSDEPRFVGGIWWIKVDFGSKNSGWIKQELLQPKNYIFASHPIQIATLQNPVAVQNSNPRITSSEVARHNKRNDCWIIIEKKVYNFTEYIASHPEEAQDIAPYCGRDGSSIIKYSTLIDPYYLGDVGNPIVVRSSEPILNASEVARHITIGNCWLIISRKVYDVTAYITSHPGGVQAIANYCGRDATTAFQTKDKTPPVSHSSVANGILNQFYIGDIGSVSSRITQQPSVITVPDPNSVVLNVVTSGQGIVAGTGISCGSDCSERYYKATVVNLYAFARDGYVFSSWGGDCSGPQLACSLRMDATARVTARFVEKPSVISTQNSVGGITIADVQQHNNLNNCWLIISGKVYNVTSFIYQHPGGAQTIINHCGEDATVAYLTKDKNPPVAHSSLAQSQLDTYFIGMLGGTDTAVTGESSTREYKLNAIAVGPGKIYGTGIDCGIDCQGSYIRGQVVTLLAVANTDARFVGWSGVCTGRDACIITIPDYDVIVRAVFEVAPIEIIPLPSPSSNLSVSCFANRSTGTTNDEITWSAIASGGSGLYSYSWTGTDSLSGSQSTARRTYGSTGTKTARVNVTSGSSSVFQNCSNSVTINSATSALQVTCNASPAAVSSGQAVTWQASATGGTGSYIYNWSGTDSLSGGAATVSKSYSTVGVKNATVTVDSGAEQVTETCNTVAVTDPSSTIQLTCAPSVTSATTNDPVTWSATVNGGNGSYAYSWSGTDGITGSNPTLNFVYSSPGIKTANLTVNSGTAQITRQCGSGVNVVQSGTGTHLVVVYKTGSGTVTGPGINCGADCREYIAPGSSLSLDQTPQSGWSFYGWSGACSGTGSCNLLMDSAKIINATFATSAPSPLSVSCSASPTSINRGDASSWGATITGGLGSYTYNWSGTDGLLGTTPSVAQVYNTVGTKSASVTVTSGAEQVTRACSNTITVGDQAALSVSCSGSPTSINTNDTANWTAAVSGGLGSYSYSWAGTDSLGGSSASVSKVYTAQGTKSADVTVASGSEQITRACGNSISVTVPTAALQASCSVNPTSASTNQNVTWTSSVSGGTGAYTYSWSGSDALSGNTSSVTRAYTSGGTKSAAVAVTSGTQQVNPTCSNSVSVTTGPPIITAQEIALHNAQSNCWWYIGTNVYNMTAYFGRHPGGNSRMLPYCGTNAEPGYNSRNHSNTADTQLASFQIGILGTVAQQNTASSLSQNMAQVFSSPAKPVRISLSAVAMSAFHANLVWKPLVEANIKEYSIIRNGELISTVDATGFVDTALSPAAGYTYKVVGLDGKGKALYESAKVTIKTKARPICGLDVLGVIPCLVEQNYPGAVLKTQNIRQNGAQLLKILWRGQCRAIGTVPDGTLVEDIKC